MFPFISILGCSWLPLPPCLPSFVSLHSLSFASQCRFLCPPPPASPFIAFHLSPSFFGNAIWGLCRCNDANRAHFFGFIRSGEEAPSVSLSEPRLTCYGEPSFLRLPGFGMAWRFGCLDGDVSSKQYLQRVFIDRLYRILIYFNDF